MLQLSASGAQIIIIESTDARLGMLLRRRRLHGRKRHLGLGTFAPNNAFVCVCMHGAELLSDDDVLRRLY